MKRLLVVLVAVLGVCACARSAEEGAGASAADTLSRRQKDSILSTLPVPGAGRIRDAQTAADRAAERASAHDTVR